jgi:hypothetical protein
LAATEPEGQAAPHPPAPGDEPLTADLGARTPRVPTRVLVVAVAVLVVLLLVSVVVGFVVLHQPRLTPVPVPSVSSIS